MTAIILTGLVFKEYEENFNIGIKELDKLTREFFDTDGFPYQEILVICFFTKYFIFCREVIKDSQKYIPEFLRTLLKNLNVFVLSKHLITNYHYLMVLLL